uniref:Uncharacterized protein n=1 Tax=viral metagenome TaxID=1070528 RepID=A0A6C0HME6_9ZZZZ
MITDILEYPKYFIYEYLNRWWVVIVALCLVIYFIYLRTYYTRREYFNHKNKSKNIVERFNDDNNTANNTTTTDTSATKSTPSLSSYANITVTDILFKNLQLSPSQIDTCLLFYKQTISTILDNLKTLNSQLKKNQYLPVDKKYSKIIADAIDGIVNLLVKTIKSQLAVTRTSIQGDLINTIQYNITMQIDDLNNNLTKQLDTLAQMNSTTIDYNTQMQGINTIRTQINELVELDTLVINNSNALLLQSSQITKALSKSTLLPIYEKNIDKINQLINSDFNGNEQRLTDKYGKMYTEFLAEDQKKELDINPLRLASQIESGTIGILSTLTNFLSGSNSKPTSSLASSLASYGDTISSTKLVEQFGFIDGKHVQQSKANIVPAGEPMPSNAGSLNTANIFNDAGNRGNYLIDNKTRKSLIEGFTITDNSTASSTASSTAADTDASANNSTIVNQITSGVTNIAESLGGTDDTSTSSTDDNPLYKFLYYALNVINGKLGFLWGMYKVNYGAGAGASTASFNLEDNMIPLGFLLFVLSMLFYFIDVTS